MTRPRRPRQARWSEASGSSGSQESISAKSDNPSNEGAPNSKIAAGPPGGKDVCADGRGHGTGRRRKRRTHPTRGGWCVQADNAAASAETRERGATAAEGTVRARYPAEAGKCGTSVPVVRGDDEKTGREIHRSRLGERVFNSRKNVSGEKKWEVELHVPAFVAADVGLEDEWGPTASAAPAGDIAEVAEKEVDAYHKGEPTVFRPVYGSNKEQDPDYRSKGVRDMAVAQHAATRQQFRRKSRKRGCRGGGRRHGHHGVLAVEEEGEDGGRAAVAEVPTANDRPAGASATRVRAKQVGEGELVRSGSEGRVGGSSKNHTGEIRAPPAQEGIHPVLLEEGGAATASVAGTRSGKNIVAVTACAPGRVGSLYWELPAPIHGGESEAINALDAGACHTGASGDVTGNKNEQAPGGTDPHASTGAVTEGDTREETCQLLSRQPTVEELMNGETREKRCESEEENLFKLNRQAPGAVKTGCNFYNFLEKKKDEKVSIRTNFIGERSGEPKIGSEARTGSKVNHAPLVGDSPLNQGGADRKADQENSSRGAAERQRRINAALSLLEMGEYEEYIRNPLTWKGTSRLKRTRPQRGPEGWTDWPLDIPDVNVMCYKALRELDNKTAEKRENMSRAIALCTDVEEFKKLFVNERWNLFTGSAGPQRSKDFEKDAAMLKQLRYTKPMSRRKIKCVIRGFCVPKLKKKKKRTILDARAVGDAQKRPPAVLLAALEDVEECVRKYKYVTELDGKGWFHQHGLSDEIAAFFGLQLGKERVAWTRLPMGWSYSVFCAHSVAEFLVDFECGDGVRILVYIDNVYVFSENEEKGREAVKEFLRRCEKVGAVFEVSTESTAKEATVLGTRVDMSEKTVRLPEDFINKLTEIRKEINLLFGEHGVSNRLLWKLFGNLMWGARVLRKRLHDFPHFTAWLSKRAADLHDREDLWEAPCYIWPRAREELEMLCDEILLAQPRSVKLPTGLAHTLHTDASDVGHGVVHDSAILTAEKGNRFSSVMKRHTIALRELYAAVAGVMDAIDMRPEIRHIVLYVDNTNAAAWLSKGKANTFFGNKLLSTLYTALGTRTLEVHWEPSAQNPADHPSRHPHKYGGMCGPKSATTLGGCCARSMAKESSKAAKDHLNAPVSWLRGNFSPEDKKSNVQPLEAAQKKEIGSPPPVRIVADSHRKQAH